MDSTGRPTALPRGAGIGIVAATAFTAMAAAAPMDLDIGHPMAVHNGPGTTTYEAASGILKIETSPMAFQLSDDADACRIRSTAEAGRSLTVKVEIAPDGTLLGGVDGDDFQLVGAIDLDDDGLADFSGVLLTGEVVGFGFDPGTPGTIRDRASRKSAAAGLADAARGRRDRSRSEILEFAGLTDTFDFELVVTGGLLEPFHGSDLGLSITSELSNFRGTFGSDFSGGARGVSGALATPDLAGGCCLPSGDCMFTTELGCETMGGTFLGGGSDCTPVDFVDEGLYRLRSFPTGLELPPPYGLRLDELFDVTAGNDVFSFDFDVPGAGVFLQYDGGSNVHIFGIAYGGLDIGDDYDPAWASWLKIDFTYTTVTTLVGDDDLYVVTPSGTNGGTVTWLETGEVFEIQDKVLDDGFSFRFGDDVDMGYPGITGIGWIMYVPDAGFGVKDWRFVAEDVCIEAEPFGACCMLDGSCMDSITEASCLAVDGTWAGPNTFCADVVCVPEDAGACCLPDGTCSVTTAEMCDTDGGTFLGTGTDCTPDFSDEAGMYRLLNAPTGQLFPPPYGLRLDELFNDDPAGLDAYTFDFEAPGAGVFMEYDGGSVVRIHGVAFGGRDIGDSYDPDRTSWIKIDFTYTTVELEAGDDDLFVNTPDGTNSGSITWLATGEVIPLTDKRLGQGFAFRFGDGTDLGPDVFGGVGWLDYDPPVEFGFRDWRFTAGPVCADPEPFGACCMADGSCMDTITEASCLVIGGTWAGPDTFCVEVDCTPAITGACCLPDGTCAVITAEMCDAEGGEYLGDDTACTPAVQNLPGCWTLRNHPDGNVAAPFYGLRLDELFDVTDNNDVFTFDFDGPDSDVTLCYDGTTIRITGVAFGGLDVGTEYDPDFTSLVELDFTYTVVENADGDDDLVVVTPSGTNSGTLTWLATGEVINLSDKANMSGLAFRFGDADDDAGHRGFDGISGWGWLMFDWPVDSGSQDWIFTAVPICEPAPPAGACCLPDGDCIETTADQCTAAGGDYAGDGTSCADVDCSVMLMGACCLPGGDCIEVTEFDCVDAGGSFAGEGTLCTPDALGGTGMYRLASHPHSPDWGVRLDELFDVTSDNDIFTFDFDAPESDMRLIYDGSTVRIFGLAWGGRRMDGGYDPDWTSTVAIDFTYEMVETASGDDDLIVTTPGMTNAGTITWLASGETFDLTDKSNGSFTFRFGDEGDDDGHDNWPGISGWGWLLHGDVNVGTWKDWRFIALPICEPVAAPATLLAHWDFNEQSGDYAVDNIGGIELKFHGDDDEVKWNSSEFGNHVDFNQDTDDDDARLETEHDDDGRDLREALQATNAITLQVYFQQDAATQNGSRVFTWSDGTSVSDRNVSVIGFENDDEDDAFDNETRLRTDDGTFQGGPEWIVDDLGGEIPVVYTMTYDAGAGNRVSIYLDGVLVYTDDSPKGDFSSWEDFRILLGNEKSKDRPFQGEIYDVKIWNAALSPAQIMAESNALRDIDGD